jgi:SMC interacting uncharacterized protein involved in chromosome segregation
MEVCVFAETIQLDQQSYEKIIERIFFDYFQIGRPKFRRLDNIIVRGKPNLLTQLPFF